MPVHEIFNFSITLGTAVILFFVMQYLGHAVVRYLNSLGATSNTARFTS